jgi:serine/threonine-protein kinase
MECQMEANFGPYRLLEPVGEGGMGQVFRAYDTVHDREVALKVLAAHVAQEPAFEQRFRREAHLAARMNEPHVVPIHSYGEIDGRLYVDMRLIAGRDLATVLAESGAIVPPRAVAIIEQVADALDAAHAINLVHRDIKPSNVLVGRRDFVHLIDFGIAQEVNATRLTRTGAAIGTFAYMAPERIETGEAAPSSDIYSLACVLYECLTGQLPFPGNSLQQQIASHLSKPPPRPSAVMRHISPAFDEVVARGMAKSPAERYPTVTAFAEAARTALDRQPREIPVHELPTQVAADKRSVPWPQLPGPGPGRWSPVQGSALGDGSARSPGRAPAQQPQQPANFLAPGVLIALFALLSALIGIYAIFSGGFAG